MVHKHGSLLITCILVALIARGPDCGALPALLASPSVAIMARAVLARAVLAQAVVFARADCARAMCVVQVSLKEIIVCNSRPHILFKPHQAFGEPPLRH